MMDKTMKSAKPVFILQTYEDRLASKELSQKLSERLSTLSMQESTPSTPPPPPPPPMSNGTHGTASVNGTLKSNKKGPAPPVPIKTSTLSYQQPPPCPTPDYDTLSITSTTSLPKQNGFNNGFKTSHNDSVEMDSLESFKLNNPGDDLKPKPPDTYFNNNTLGNGTLRKTRPVSVTIGEYPSGTLRRQPGRLDFISRDPTPTPSPNDSISNQLASELAQTLSRSNLRKKTESMENLLNSSQFSPSKNGSIRISCSDQSFAKTLTKSTNDLSAFESLSKALANRVTINVSTPDKKTEPPSGILKTGTHKPLMQQKSITFGEVYVKILTRLM